jgi:hypothetical protein
VAKTRSSKHAETQARDALKGLRADLKRLGKSLSKQLRGTKGKAKHGNRSAPSGDMTVTAAKRTKTSAHKTAAKTTKAAKKKVGAKSK